MKGLVPSEQYFRRFYSLGQRVEKPTLISMKGTCCENVGGDIASPESRHLSEQRIL